MARIRNPTNSIAKFDPGDEPWRCCAESKMNLGHRCKNKAEPGRRTCRFHGGTSRGRRPITGRHSAVMNRLRDVYERSLEDPDLLDVREPIALISSIVHRFVEQTEDNDTPEFRVRAIKLYRAAMRSRNSDSGEFESNIDELGDLLDRGASEASALTGLMRSVSSQAKIINDAIDKQLRREQAISRGDLILLVHTLLSATHNSILQASAEESVIDGTAKRVANKVSELVERHVLIPAGMSLGATGEGFLIGQASHEVEDTSVEEVGYDPIEPGQADPSSPD